VESDSQLLETVRYIALNPVRAGMCSAPDAWPWSSYRYLVGEGPEPDFLSSDSLLECISFDPRQAPAGMRRFVEAGIPRRRRLAA
jgi:putative transposase